MPDAELAASLVPRHKHDVARAERAAAAGYPAVAPILGELLQWIRDYNWPVAKVLAPALASVGLPLLPHLRSVFDGHDLVWQRWCLECIVADSRLLAESLAPELRRLASSSTSAERAEDLAEISLGILDQHGLGR
jgi:hypothetical protein